MHDDADDFRSRLVNFKRRTKGNGNWLLPSSVGWQEGVVPMPKRRVLIVEDDVASRKALIQILAVRGIMAWGVSSLAQALEALTQKPRTLILDLMLPDGNGIEVLRQVRQAQLPIRVALLTGADRPMIEEAAALQPDAVFTKPVDLARLLHWLMAA